MVLIELVRGNIERLLADAESAFRQKDPEAGRLLVNAALALDPDNAEARRLLESCSNSPERRRYTRIGGGRVAEPLPTPGVMREYCESSLRREFSGFMNKTTIVWLEAHSVGPAGRHLIYRSPEWKPGKQAPERYDQEVSEMVRSLTADGWKQLPCDLDDTPRFQR